MTPVKQNLFGKHTGNCLQAALATVLDLPLWKVPHFSNWSVSNWWFQLDSWVNEELDKHLVCSECPDQRQWCVAVGRSPRGPYPHAVVAYGQSLYFDPHPSNGMLVGDPEYYIVIEDKENVYR
jgi:hypothetical protein